MAGGAREEVNVVLTVRRLGCGVQGGHIRVLRVHFRVALRASLMGVPGLKSGSKSGTLGRIE